MFSESLEFLRQKGLLREIRDHESANNVHIIIQGTEYVNFSSNDYLGLTDHSALKESAKNCIDRFGAGAGASRLLSGGTTLHRELEQRIALYKGAESALVLNSGYSANTGIIPSIAGEGDAIFSDELNHASIIDGCRLSRAKTYVYQHKDFSGLRKLLNEKTARRRIVVTDSVFSMHGDIAPIKEIFDICRQSRAIFYIDDAHATGVLGKGRGSLSHFNIQPEPWVIQMGTFSKALGSFGAFVACDRNTCDWILNTARSFIFSTALPAHVIAASLAALDIIEKDRSLIEKLWSNIGILLRGLQSLGYDVSGCETPIIPIWFSSVEEALQKSEALLRNGIFAPAVRPPTVKKPMIRVTITAAHSREDIERLIKALSL